MRFSKFLFICLLLITSSVTGFAQFPFGGSWFSELFNGWNSSCRDYRVNLNLNEAKDSLTLSVNEPSKVTITSNEGMEEDFEVTEKMTISVIPARYKVTFRKNADEGDRTCTTTRYVTINFCDEYETSTRLNENKDTISMSVNKPSKVTIRDYKSDDVTFELTGDTTFKILPAFYAITYQSIEDGRTKDCKQTKYLMINPCEGYKARVTATDENNGIKISVNKPTTVLIKSNKDTITTFALSADTVVQVEPNHYYVRLQRAEEGYTRCVRTGYVYLDPCGDYEVSAKLNETQDSIAISVNKPTNLLVRTSSDTVYTLSITEDTKLAVSPNRYEIQFQRSEEEYKNCKKYSRVSVDACSDYKVSLDLNEEEDQVTFTVSHNSNVVLSTFRDDGRSIDVTDETTVDIEPGLYFVQYKRLADDGTVTCTKFGRIYIDPCKDYEAEGVLNEKGDSLTITVNKRSRITIMDRRFSMKNFEIESDTTIEVTDKRFTVFAQELKEDDKIGCGRYIRVKNPNARGRSRIINSQKQPITTAVYPNPASDQAFVNLSEYAGKEVSLSIIDNVGSLVHQIKQLQPTTEPQALPVHLLETGIYYLTIHSDGELPVTKKLIINK